MRIRHRGGNFDFEDSGYVRPLTKEQKKKIRQGYEEARKNVIISTKIKEDDVITISTPPVPEPHIYHGSNQLPLPYTFTDFLYEYRIFVVIIAVIFAIIFVVSQTNSS